MASERNRILDLVQYIESCGVEVNIGKNKARGNKGFFKATKKSFRIDIAKNQSEESILRTLAHEFAHYVHYQHDRTLMSLSFIFDESDEITEELILATVATIPKKTVQPIFDLESTLKKEIKNLKSELKLIGCDFKSIEYEIKNKPYKYLLKHDRVKVQEGFNIKYYSIDSLQIDDKELLYLKYCSKKRALNRVRSRISKLNGYYNAPTELFARSFELYVAQKESLLKVSPRIYEMYEKNIHAVKNPLLTNFVKISSN